MNKAISLLTRPLGNQGAFLFSGLLALGFSSIFLALAWMIGEFTLVTIGYPLLGFLTGVLLLFRTKAGTIFYWFFLFTLAHWRIERGVTLSGIKDAIPLLLSAGILFCFVIMGWEQIEYHFSKRSSSKNALKQKFH